MHDFLMKQPSGPRASIKRLANNWRSCQVPPVLLVLVILAAALKTFFFARVMAEPSLAIAFGDPGSYYELAQDLAHNWRFDSPIRPILFPFVYAVLVSLFGSAAPLALVLLNYLASILTGLILYGLVRGRTTRDMPALLAFSAFGLNPVLTLYESSTFSEPLYLLLCAVGMSVYLDARPVFTGVSFAAASLVRPAAVHLFGLIVLYEVTLRRRRAVLISVFVFAAIVGPWAVRYHAKYGQFGLSNIGDFNIGLYQVNFVYADARGLPITEARKEWILHVYRQGGFSGRYPRPDTTLLESTAAYWSYRRFPEITRFARQEAVRLYLAHPRSTLKYVLTGIALTAVNPASGPIGEFFGFPESELRRDKVIDSLLRLDLVQLRDSGVLDYLNWAASLSAIHLAINLLLFAYLAQGLVRRETHALLLLLFAASWFIAGFAGVGAARHFVGAYVFFVAAALIPAGKDNATVLAEH